MNHLDVLEIHWVDSEAHAGWTEAGDIPKKLGLVIACGILAYESSESVVLACSYDQETDSFNPLFTIPKVAIKKRKTLCKLKMKK
jgi:hypothetical protein